MVHFGAMPATPKKSTGMEFREIILTVNGEIIYVKNKLIKKIIDGI